MKWIKRTLLSLVLLLSIGILAWYCYERSFPPSERRFRAMHRDLNCGIVFSFASKFIPGTWDDPLFFSGFHYFLERSTEKMDRLVQVQNIGNGCGSEDG